MADESGLMRPLEISCFVDLKWEWKKMKTERGKNFYLMMAIKLEIFESKRRRKIHSAASEEERGPVGAT